MKARAIDLLLYPKLFSGGVASMNTIKGRANHIVKMAVLEGRLVRQPCEVCGVADRLQDDGCPLIEAHHHSYRPEHWLDVIWLCRTCHKQVHAGKLQEPRTDRWYVPGPQRRNSMWPTVPVHVAANGQMTLPEVPANTAAPRRRLKSAA